MYSEKSWMTTTANSESESSSYFCLWEAQGESLLWDVLVVLKDMTSHVLKVGLIQKEFWISWPCAGQYPCSWCCKPLSSIQSQNCPFLWGKSAQQWKLARVSQSVGKGCAASEERLPWQSTEIHAEGLCGMGSAWQRWQQQPWLHFAGDRFWKLVWEEPVVLTASFPKPVPTASGGTAQMEAATSSLPGCITPDPITSTKLAKPQQTERLEEQLEELLKRRYRHKKWNPKALMIPCGDLPYKFPWCSQKPKTGPSSCRCHTSAAVLLSQSCSPWPPFHPSPSPFLLGPTEYSQQ